MAPDEKGGMCFEADFTSANEDSLEILLFVDGLGNLPFIEIDLNGNSAPVPDDVNVVGPPYHVHVSAGLLLD